MMVDTSAQLEHERHELLRQKTLAEHAADEARVEIDNLRQRLLVVETDLARARQAGERQAGDLERAETRLKHMEEELAEAQRAIREMKTTRVWRVGTAYWRLRDRLLRDG
jgi:chromosome segregation ATPase